jgi:GYF domain 2
VQIYITKNQQQLGPYSPAEARNRIIKGQLTGSDLAWHAGLTSWTTLAEVLGSYSSHPSLGPIAPRPQVEVAQPSGLSITSLVTAIIGAIGWVTVLIVAVLVDKHGRKDDNDPMLLVLGLMFLGGLLVNVFGGIAGVAALIKGQSYKPLAITGLIFNALELLVIIALAALGMAMK